MDVDNEVVHSTADEDNGILSRSSSPQEARAMSKEWMQFYENVELSVKPLFQD